MPVTTQVPSEQIRQALLAGPGFFRPGDASAGVLVNARWGQPVYTLGLNQIPLEGNALPGEVTSWRFLTRSMKGAGIAGHVSVRADGPPKMTGVWRGPQVDKAIQAAEKVQELPETRDHDYELRVLRIPGLRVEAYWLKSVPIDRSDLILPYLTLLKPLESMRGYTIQAFLETIRPLAAEELEHHPSA